MTCDAGSAGISGTIERDASCRKQRAASGREEEGVRRRVAIAARGNNPPPATPGGSIAMAESPEPIAITARSSGATLACAVAPNASSTAMAVMAFIGFTFIVPHKKAPGRRPVPRPGHDIHVTGQRSRYSTPLQFGPAVLLS